jgi:hypothetical protein
MSKSACEEEISPEEQEYEEAANCLVFRDRVLNKADWIVPTKVHDDRHEGVPEELNDDIGEDKHVPSVNLGWALASFEKIALVDECGHDLLVDVDEEHEKHEDCPKLILKSLDGVVGTVTEA